MATPQALDTVGNISAGLTGYFRSAVDAVSDLGTHAQQALSSPEAFAAMAKHMPLNQFLNTIDKHSPEFSSATEVMRENPQLGNAFHDAFVNNEEFRNRLMNPPAGDTNALSAQNIGAILTDEKYGSQAQTLMTGMLQKVSRGEMNIGQVEQIAGAGVNMMSVGNDEDATKEQRAEAQQKFIETLEKNGLPTGQIKGEQIFAYLREVMNGDPKSAAANFVNALGLSGEQAAAMQELLTMAGGLLKFLGKPYVDFVNKHGPGITHDMTDMYERLSGERDISVSAQRAELSPAQRAQDEISAQGNAPGAMQGQATVHNEGMEGAGARTNLAETFGLERDAQGTLSVPDATAERLREMDAQYASRTSGPMMAGI